MSQGSSSSSFWLVFGVLLLFSGADFFAADKENQSSSSNYSISYILLKTKYPNTSRNHSNTQFELVKLASALIVWMTAVYLFISVGVVIPAQQEEVTAAAEPGILVIQVAAAEAAGTVTIFTVAAALTSQLQE